MAAPRYQGRRRAVPLLCAILLALAAALPARSEPVPVLLSFDTETGEDADAIRLLNVQEPATYFFTGEFAESYPELVAMLAERNTIGSHSYSHPDLTALNEIELRKELLLPKLILEKVTGRPPIWFRAPFLRYDDRVIAVLRELGFRFDSSDQERWARDHELVELPISSGSDYLASDYELFDQQHLTGNEALDWLKDLYQERSALGRPVVLLLHPRIIAQRSDALHGFIRYVKEQGGVFQTADEFVQRALAASPGRWGVWVDFSLGEHDPELIAADLHGAGLTDAFVMVRDPEGNRYYIDEDSSPSGASGRDLFGETVRALKEAGVRVHAWMPAFRDPRTAQMRPELAMYESGGRSIEWLSPTHPEVRAQLLELVRHLVTSYDVDGIHLDYFRYPRLQADRSPEVIAAFGATVGLPDLTVDEAVSTFYTHWTEWRAEQLAEVAEEVRDTVRRATARTVIVSAALIADAARSFQSVETYGQDYSKLAEHLDLIVPMAYHKEDRRPVKWIGDTIFAARYRIGLSTPLFTGIEAYQKPGQWTQNVAAFGEALGAARAGSDGIVLYPYLPLFGRDEPGWDMPRGAVEALVQRTREWAGSSDSLLDRSGSDTVLDPMGGTASVGSWPSGQSAARWNFATLALTAVGVGAVGAVVIVARRKTRAILDRSGDGSLLALPGAQVRASDGRLQLAISEAEDYAGLPELLRGLGPLGIERCRIAFVLALLERSGESLSAALDALWQTPGWRRIALRYLEECSLLGYVALEGERASLTQMGQRELHPCAGGRI